MIFIDYPPYQYKIREVPVRKQEIWDEVRRQWVSLTPEEWVRQNFLQILVTQQQYPAPYIAIERKIEIGSVRKRYDILVYNKAARPWMIVECKSKDIPLDKKVLAQVLNYNIAVPVPFLIITNGHYCYGYHRINDELKEIAELPEYE